MSDRLEEIRERFNEGDYGPNDWDHYYESDIKWLIAEVERLRERLESERCVCPDPDHCEGCEAAYVANCKANTTPPAEDRDE